MQVYQAKGLFLLLIFDVGILMLPLCYLLVIFIFLLILHGIWREQQRKYFINPSNWSSTCLSSFRIICSPAERFDINDTVYAALTL